MVVEVGNLKGGLIEVISPFLSSRLEQWDVPRPIAQVVGKGGAMLAATILVGPWEAQLRVWAIMLNLASWVLPYGDVGAWPNAEDMIDLVKKRLIEQLPP